MTTGWRRVLVATTSAGLIWLGLCSAAAALVDGVWAAASVAAGGGVVIALSFISLAVVDLADRYMPNQTLLFFIAAYALKLMVAAGLFVTVPIPEWIFPVWAAMSALAVLLVWQVALVLSFRKLRFPIFSLPAGES